VPVVMGGQTTSTMELARLARAAADIGAEYMQVSPPFYFAHTDDDFMDHVAAAEAASDVGMVVYNTHWTSLEISNALIDRLAGLGTVVGLKWSMPDNGFMEFEGVVADHSDRFTIIDNQLRFPTSHMLGPGASRSTSATSGPSGGCGCGRCSTRAATSRPSTSW